MYTYVYIYIYIYICIYDFSSSYFSLSVCFTFLLLLLFFIFYFALRITKPFSFIALHLCNKFSVYFAHFNHIVWLIERQHIYHVMHFLKMKVFNFQNWQKVHRKLLMWKNKGNLKMRNLRSLIELFPPIINSFWIPFFSIDEH